VRLPNGGPALAEQARACQGESADCDSWCRRAVPTVVSRRCAQCWWL